MSGKVNESLWRIVRLRPDTVTRLRVFEARVRAAREMGFTEVNPNEQDQISLDALICELLRRDEEHMERSLKATKAKARRLIGECEKGKAIGKSTSNE